MSASATKGGHNKLQTKSLLNCFHDNGKRQTRQLDVSLHTEKWHIHHTVPQFAQTVSWHLLNLPIFSCPPPATVWCGGLMAKHWTCNHEVTGSTQ